MKKKILTRLAILLSQLGWTHQALAKRAGLSTVYVRFLKNGKRPMTQRPAIAIAAATGVDPQWLLGRVPPLPIRASFHRLWSVDMAEQIEKRKLDPKAAHEDADHCLVWFLINSHRLAKIILAAYKAKKPMLALARIHTAMSALADEFKVPAEKLPFRVNRDSEPFSPTGTDEAASLIVNRLVQDLKAAIKNRPTASPKPAPKPAKPSHRR